ncbi:MAG: class I SAM-dependent methyltransferase [Acetobacteraceae bacterium]|jgi:SAM-dependent methyltransferase
MLAEYYRKRAAEYDAFYADPARQADLTVLRDWLATAARGRRILEVAAGTGYWTAAAAPLATAITATDINAETLAIASSKQLGEHVTLLQADAWDLPHLADAFDLGMAHLWWSHLRKQQRARFLERFAAHLEPGATLLMIDENLVANVGAPIVRRDVAGDTWQRRWLAGGERFEIVKNYPDAAELERSVGTVCEDVRVLQLQYFWALSARLLPVSRAAEEAG